MIEVFGRGGALKSSWYGDCLPSRDFPVAQSTLDKRLDLDAFVSETIGIDDVEMAFEKMHHGAVLRSVIVLMVAQIERIVTSGQFSLDGGTWDVDNNVWIIGDEREVVVIDAAHDALAIEEAVNGRRVKAIVCTHAHNDHINVAAELAENTGAWIWLHPDDEVLCGWSTRLPARQRAARRGRPHRRRHRA